MKQGVVFDIRRYSVHDGPGIRTTVFLKGCPMRCSWCHNPESIRKNPQPIRRTRTLDGWKREYEETVGRWMSSEEVMDVILKDRLFYDESGGGVTFSGGEPLFQPDFLLEMLQMCRDHGIHTTVDTSGYAQKEVFLSVAEKADLLLFDFKTPDDHMHKKHTGVGNQKIMHNLESLTGNGPELVIRIPVISDFNNNMTHMKQIGDRLLNIPAKVKSVDLLPFHRLGRHKYESLGMDAPGRFREEIQPEQMQEFMDYFKEAGFIVKEGG